MTDDLDIPLLRAIFRPWHLRIIFGSASCLAFYDVLSNQFGLPTLRKIFGLSGSLMPWWGWLLVLQAIFVLALFEYVRRVQLAGGFQFKTNIPIEAPSFNEVSSLVESSKNSLRGEIAGVENHIRHIRQASAEQADRIAEINRQIAVKYPNASTIAEAFSNLEQAYLGQMRRIRSEIDPVKQGAQSANLDLLFLLDWARGTETALLIPLLLEQRPKADAIAPPAEDTKCAELQNEMRRWLSTVSSTLGYIVKGGDVRLAMQSAHESAEYVVRKIQPGDRPKGIDPLTFHDFFILAAETDAAEKALLRLVEEHRDLTLSTMSELRNRYSERSKQ